MSGDIRTISTPIKNNPMHAYVNSKENLNTVNKVAERMTSFFLSHKKTTDAILIMAAGVGILAGTRIERAIPEVLRLAAVLGIAAVAAGVMAGIIDVAEKTSSRSLNPSFFGALLRNHLNTMPSKKEKETFLQELEHDEKGPWIAFAHSCLTQLLTFDEDLTEENTPTFFHDEPIGMLPTILRKEINSLRAEWKSLSQEERSDIKFADESHSPKTRKLQEIQAKGRRIIARAILLGRKETILSVENIQEIRRHFL